MEKGLRFTIRDSGNTLGYGVVTGIYDEDTDMEAYKNARKMEKKEKKKAEKEEQEKQGM